MSNYTYSDGAIHNDHHKEMTINVSGKTDITALMKAFMAENTEVVEETSFDETTVKTVFPEVLCTPEARTLYSKLFQAGWLDEHWQPVGLSNAEKGTLIDYIAENLNIRSKWKFFGSLWNMDSETLRTSKARGLEQARTWKFRGQLDAL